MPPTASKPHQSTAVLPHDVVLTGDRPTGALHLGHYAGSLANRVAIQKLVARQFLLLADLQALTDNAREPGRISSNILEVALDYLAAVIDPNCTDIVLQSGVPELSELTMLYLNLVTVSRLERNPTIRSEIELRGFQRDIPAGFLCYPAAQAADITGFGATLVPVGEDQLPMIELSNEIVGRVNRLGNGDDILPFSRAMLSSTPRLPGIDGRKASKSLGNAIPLGASEDTIRQAVQQMYTDRNHLKVSDPGTTDGNVVFAHLDAFDPDTEGLEEMKAHYRRGGLGDNVTKRRLENILQDLLSPIRQRRSEFARDPGEVMRLVRRGTERGREQVASTMRRIRAVFCLGEPGAC